MAKRLTQKAQRKPGSSSVKEPVTFTNDVEQRSQNNRENEHNSDQTKKNFTCSYTEVNPKILQECQLLVKVSGHLSIVVREYLILTKFREKSSALFREY